MILHTTLLGKRNSTEWGNCLELSNLFPERGAVRSVTIISAYTDIDMLEMICSLSLKKSDNRSKVRIRIFLDRLASTYENEGRIKKQMDSLSKKIDQKGGDGSGIWLVKIGSLFHSKSVVVETNTSITCMIGSLNMTKKAFARNEELVLLGESNINSKTLTTKIAKWITSEYCQKLLDNSKKVPFSKDKIEPNSLQSLMLSGVMFHEVKESDPFRFAIGLPKKFLEVKQAIHPLMKAELNDSISIESIVTGSNINGGLEYVLPEIVKEGSRESWKKYCLDTCYGYWCPDLLRDDAKQAIESKKELRRPKFEGEDGRGGLFSIVSNKKEEITEKFKAILSSLNNKIIEEKIEDHSWDMERVVDRWGNWYDRLLTKLKNEEICNRIVLGVTSSPVPNVWSDPITSTEFEISFLDSLQFAFSKGDVGRFRKVIITLRDVYQLDPEIILGESDAGILQHLEDRIFESSKNNIIEDFDDYDDSGW